MTAIDQLFGMAARIILEEEAKRPCQSSYLEYELITSLSADTGWTLDRVKRELKGQIAKCAFEMTVSRVFDLHSQYLIDAHDHPANTTHAPLLIEPEFGRSNLPKSVRVSHERELPRPH